MALGCFLGPQLPTTLFFYVKNFASWPRGIGMFSITTAVGNPAMLHGDPSYFVSQALGCMFVAAVACSFSSIRGDACKFRFAALACFLSPQPCATLFRCVETRVALLRGIARSLWAQLGAALFCCIALSLRLLEMQ